MEDAIIGIGFASLAALTWGINSHILHRGAQNEHPYMALIYRAIISLPILLTLTLILRNVESLFIYLEPSNLLLTTLLVASIVLGDGIFIYSMKKYPVSVILPIATTYPLLVAIILIIFGIENLTLFIILGTIAVVIGIYLVTKYRYDLETKQSGINIEALLLGLGVAFGWGISVIFGRLILDKPITESFGLMTARTLIIGIIAFFLYFGKKENRENFKEKSQKDKLTSMKIFGISGIFGWVLGATFLFLALENVRAAIATSISASNPVIAVLIGQFLGIDKINLKQFSGIILVTLGVILIVI